MDEFSRIGIDYTVPYTGVIMTRPETPDFPHVPLPSGYYFSTFEPSDEARWIDLQLAVRHIEAKEEARCTFRKEFLLDSSPNLDMSAECCPGFELVRQRMVLIKDAVGNLAGTAALWMGNTMGEMRSRVHWVAVHPNHQGQGLSKCLMSRLLEIHSQWGHPGSIYLTSQTRSYKAISVYLQFGFVPYLGPALPGWDNGAEIKLGSFEEENEAAWQLINFKRSLYKR